MKDARAEKISSTVWELVEAAERAVGADMALNVKPNPFNSEVLAAAFRVREAMGNGKEEL